MYLVRSLSRPSRRLLHISPLDRLHRERKGRMVPFGGWELPLVYDGSSRGVLETVGFIRKNAGLFDVSHMLQTEIIGDEEVIREKLSYLLPVDFDRMGIGQCRYTVLLREEDAGVIDDLIVMRVGNGVYRMVTNAATSEVVRDTLKERLQGVRIRDLTKDGWAMLAIQGPRSESMLRELFPDMAIPCKFMQALRVTEPKDLLISRTGYTGEDGFELSLPGPGALLLSQQLLTRYRLPANDQLELGGLAARDVMRMEMGYSLSGFDFEEGQLNPVQAGLMMAISKRRLKEPRDFRGKRALLKVLEDDVGLVKTGLKGDRGYPIPRHNYPLYASDSKDSQKIGRITSGTYSPTGNFNIALALIPSGFTNPVYYEREGKWVRMIPTALPFIPAKTESIL